MSTQPVKTGPDGETPERFRVPREQKGLHGQVWGYRVNALVFWIVFFHLALLVPPVLAWTLLFLGFSSLSALLVALGTISLSLGISLAWARYTYRKETRWTAILHRGGAEKPAFHRLASDPVSRGVKPESNS